MHLLSFLNFLTVNTYGPENSAMPKNTANPPSTSNDTDASETDISALNVQTNTDSKEVNLEMANNNIPKFSKIVESTIASNLVDKDRMNKEKMLESSIRKAFNMKFDPLQKYVISIQGASTSGKSTLCNIIAKILNEKCSDLCKAIIISTDSFYKSQSSAETENNGDYDYDNPAAINWDAFVKTFNSLIDNSETYIESTYDFIKMTREEKNVLNPGFNIIIVEGIFAHNIFNEQTFNVGKFCPYESSRVIEDPYVKNTLNINRSKYHLLKVLMSLEKEKMLTNRILVDMIRANRSEKEARERFERFVWPATKKWVDRNDISKSEVLLMNGSWNVSKSCNFLNDLLCYFGAKTTSDELAEDLKRPFLPNPSI